MEIDKVHGAAIKYTTVEVMIDDGVLRKVRLA